MKLTEDQKRVLAQTLLGEAGGEGLEGMAAVAHVIKNRTGSPRFPNDPVSVALQPQQFSTWNSGEGGNNPGRYGPGSPGYADAIRAVELVFEKNAPDPTGGGTHYWSPSGMRAMGYASDPYWAKSEEGEGGRVQIGNHVFLAKQKPSVSALAAIQDAAPNPQPTIQRQAFFDPTGGRPILPEPPYDAQESAIRSQRVRENERGIADRMTNELGMTPQPLPVTAPRPAPASDALIARSFNAADQARTPMPQPPVSIPASMADPVLAQHEDRKARIAQGIADQEARRAAWQDQYGDLAQSVDSMPPPSFPKPVGQYPELDPLDTFGFSRSAPYPMPPIARPVMPEPLRINVPAGPMQAPVPATQSRMFGLPQLPGRIGFLQRVVGSAANPSGPERREMENGLRNIFTRDVGPTNSTFAADTGRSVEQINTYRENKRKGLL